MHDTHKNSVKGHSRIQDLLEKHEGLVALNEHVSKEKETALKVQLYITECGVSPLKDLKISIMKDAHVITRFISSEHH